MERFYLRYCSQMPLGLKRIQDGRSDLLGRHPGPECDATLALRVADHSSLWPFHTARHLLLGRLEESPPWKTVLRPLCKGAIGFGLFLVTLLLLR